MARKITAARLWKRLRQARADLAFSAPRRGALTALGCALTGLLLTMAVRVLGAQSLGGAADALSRPDGWYTALMLSLVCAALAFALHSLFAAGALTALPTLALALINYYKAAITATPLQLGDFALAGRLGNIVRLNAGSITFSPITALVLLAALLWLGALWFFSRPLRLPWGRSLGAALIPALLWLQIFFAGADEFVFTPLKLPLSVPAAQNSVNRECGVLLGLWRSVLTAGQTAPGVEQYSRETMELLLAQAQEDLPAAPAPERKQPHVILILSESFFDVTELPGVAFEEDPLADFHALQAEGVSGTFHTRTLGYGTCNIELEILTGINTALLSFEDLYSMDAQLLGRLPTVPALLREQGYDAVMLHLFNDGIYHRAPAFRAIGFDELYFSADFAAIDPDAPETEEAYWSYMDQYVRGGFYSDDYMTDLFIDLYEDRSGQAPLFLYGISMENHTPHNGEKYAPEEVSVRFTSPLDGESEGILTDVSQGAADASAALGRLADYFRGQDEPVVIIFYGDHRPGLGLANGTGTVYSQLGMVPGMDQGQWTLEQLAELHATSYVIWSNDPDYLPAAPGTQRDESSNYLGATVLECAGVSLPLYWRMLRDASTVRLEDTNEYHMDAAGVPSRNSPTDQESLARLSRLTLCLYDALYGEQYITGRLGE